MRTQQLKNHLSDTELKERIRQSAGQPEFPRWQILYLIQVGNIHSADVIAPLVNLSKPSVYKIVQQYNNEGPGTIKLSKRGGRRRFLLSEEQEIELLDSIKDNAEKGLIKTAKDIKQLAEKKVGKTVSDDFIWDLLKRNGWKKKMPRPHHPKRNTTEQQEFKKNSPTMWMPPSGQ